MGCRAAVVNLKDNATLNHTRVRTIMTTKVMAIRRLATAKMETVELQKNPMEAPLMDTMKSVNKKIKKASTSGFRPVHYSRQLIKISDFSPYIVTEAYLFTNHIMAMYRRYVKDDKL